MFFKSILILLFMFPSSQTVDSDSDTGYINGITCIYCHYCIPKQYIAEKTFGDGSFVRTPTSIFICQKTDGRMWVDCEMFRWVPEQRHIDSLYFADLGNPYVIVDTTYTMDTTCVERMDEI